MADMRLVEDRMRLAKTRCRRLRKAGFEIVADHIEDCAVSYPCGYAACPHCMEKWKTGIVTIVRKAFEGVPLVHLTIVPDIWHRRPGELSSFDPTTAITYLKRRLKKAGAETAPVVGYLDLSFNEHQDKIWASRWQPHASLIMREADWKRLEPNRGRLAGQATSIHRPVRANQVRNFDRQVSYVFKSEATRKSYHSKFQPKTYDLRGNLETEFVEWLGAASVNKRLFIWNARRRRTKLVLEG